VSGSVNRRVVERTARFGSGWIPWGEALGDPASAVPEFRRRLDAELDRLRSAGESTALSSAVDLGVVATTKVEVPAGAGDVQHVVGRALAAVQPALDVGVTDVRVSLPGSGDWVPDVVDALRAGLLDRTSG
jgi:hypothetical protein